MVDDTILLSKLITDNNIIAALLKIRGKIICVLLDNGKNNTERLTREIINVAFISKKITSFI